MDKYRWKDDLSDKLVDGFIHYQWRLDNPFPSPSEMDGNISQPPWITQYQTDSMFHAKVQNLVAGVMGIVIPEVEALMDSDDDR